MSRTEKDEVEDYLRALQPNQREALLRLQKTIASVMPEAKEGISTKVPAFRYKGRYLVSYSATKHHCALLVMQGDAMKVFATELAPFATGSRIIRFSPDRPLPSTLIKKIVLWRKAEIDQVTSSKSTDASR